MSSLKYKTLEELKVAELDAEEYKPKRYDSYELARKAIEDSPLYMLEIVKVYK